MTKFLGNVSETIVGDPHIHEWTFHKPIKTSNEKVRKLTFTIWRFRALKNLIYPLIRVKNKKNNLGVWKHFQSRQNCYQATSSCNGMFCSELVAAKEPLRQRVLKQTSPMKKNRNYHVGIFLCKQCWCLATPD